VGPLLPYFPHELFEVSGFEKNGRAVAGRREQHKPLAIGAYIRIVLPPATRNHPE
jgi:hypothetical protein